MAFIDACVTRRQRGLGGGGGGYGTERSGELDWFDDAMWPFSAKNYY